jgi:pyruvate dehydrogenase E2 component (dihydrolipoamide acetyltransferase)
MKEITMPKLSDTMTEGTVVVWRKAVGSQVERGEVIAEVETDKATMELEAFASGELLEIRVAAGKTVPVGTVIGLIGTADEKPVAPPVSPVPATPPEPRAEAVPPPAPPVPAVPVAVESADGVLAAPVVRRRARELGIDLAKLAGSGPGGRILLEDLEPGETRRPPEQPASVPVVEPVVPPPAAGGVEGEPLSKMRLAIARTVSESWRTIPHFSVTVEVRMDAAERFRQQRSGQTPGLSLTALLIKAAALALREFPRLNASLQNDRLIVHPQINVGIAVRREDGLLVPVLRECAALSLAETAQRTAQLVERARNGQLSQTELSGGTFAISNLGMYGVHSFVALILPPMAAVLAVGAVRDGVVVEQQQLMAARLLSLTLSADHRLADGAYAAEFLQYLKSVLEQPERLAD